MLLGTVLVIIATVVRAFLLYEGFGVYAWKEVGPVDTFHGSQLLYACGGNQQVLVVVQCLIDELLQSGVGIYFPPLHVGNGKCIALLGLGETLGQIKLGACIVSAQLARSHTEASCQNEHIE